MLVIDGRCKTNIMRLDWCIINLNKLCVTLRTNTSKDTLVRIFIVSFFPKKKKKQQQIDEWKELVSFYAKREPAEVYLLSISFKLHVPAVNWFYNLVFFSHTNRYWSIA